MAWPPTPLPINFQNATVSLDTHPTAHNTTNLQINNDIVPYINDRSTVKYAYRTSSQADITSIVDIAGMTVTIPTQTGRLYRIVAQLELLSNVAGDVVTLYVTDSNNLQLTRATTKLAEINTAETMVCTTLFAGGPGSKTIKLRAARVAGTGVALMFADPTTPALLSVEFLGPDN